MRKNIILTFFPTANYFTFGQSANSKEIFHVDAKGHPIPEVPTILMPS